MADPTKPAPRVCFCCGSDASDDDTTAPPFECKACRSANCCTFLDGTEYRGVGCPANAAPSRFAGLEVD